MAGSIASISGRQQCKIPLEKTKKKKKILFLPKCGKNFSLLIDIFNDCKELLAVIVVREAI